MVLMEFQDGTDGIIDGCIDGNHGFERSGFMRENSNKYGDNKVAAREVSCAWLSGPRLVTDSNEELAAFLRVHCHTAIHTAVEPR